MPELYKFQEKALSELCSTKRICVMAVGSGKSAVMMRWLKAQRKPNVLIVTTATKARSGDFEADADTWNGEEWKKTLSSFSVVSWHKLKRWWESGGAGVRRDARNWAIAFDEVQKSKGYMTGMGKTFQNICRYCETWSGYTATPGDKWIDIMPYLVATRLVKNKTAFMANYAVVQTFKGFPEIVRYVNIDDLKKKWRAIAAIPDTSEMYLEMPKHNEAVRKFGAPKDYHKVLKTFRRLDNGELIETTMGLCQYLRQICFTKDKQEWITDFIENLGTNAVIFCNYIEEEETVCAIANKVLPKGAKVWRIDGRHHEIPTPDTIGKYDIVVAHYDSGGEALNLQFMHYWVSVSPNYSYSKTVQAKGRIERIGQKFPMFFYTLQTKGTIEDSIMRCLSNKEDFAETVWAAQVGIDL